MTPMQDEDSLWVLEWNEADTVQVGFSHVTIDDVYISQNVCLILRLEVFGVF